MPVLKRWTGSAWAEVTDPAATATAILAHAGAVDPHADRAYTDTKIAALVNSAPSILDTLGEIATALQSDESTAAALATTVAGKLAKSSNLSDVANVVTALQNLGIDRSGITDGQLMAWSASLSKFLPVNPAGASELAYAENVTGTQTAVAGAASAAGSLVDIPGCSISVPVSSRPVMLEASFDFTQTVTGQGQATLLIVETTGAATTVRSANTFLANNTGPRSQNGLVRAKFRLGATSGVRTFKLNAQCGATGATVPTFNVLNSVTAPSYIAAMAG